MRKLRKILGGSLEGRRFALWGLAFKPNTDDLREAPSRVIVDELLAAGAQVRAYDPIAMGAARAAVRGTPEFSLARDAYDACEGADALLIATEWREFRSPDFERLKTAVWPCRESSMAAISTSLRCWCDWASSTTPRAAACPRWRIDPMASAERTLIPVVLSGGAGTRLWPLSRELYPKQLLPLTGEHTMLQDTVRRLNGLLVAAPLVVCNEAHRFLVAEQLRAIDCRPQAIVLEPVGRNTAPAIALAAHAALATGNTEPLLLVLPADHVIRDVAELPARGARGRAGGAGRPSGHLWDRAAHPRNRLRLHPPRRPDARRQLADCPLCREARARQGAKNS